MFYRYHVRGNKTNFFIVNFRSTLYVSLLKAKILAKIIEITNANKKN